MFITDTVFQICLILIQNNTDNKRNIKTVSKVKCQLHNTRHLWLITLYSSFSAGGWAVPAFPHYVRCLSSHMKHYLALCINNLAPAFNRILNVFYLTYIKDFWALSLGSQYIWNYIHTFLLRIHFSFSAVTVVCKQKVTCLFETPGDTLCTMSVVVKTEKVLLFCLSYLWTLEMWTN